MHYVTRSGHKAATWFIMMGAMSTEIRSIGEFKVLLRAAREAAGPGGSKLSQEELAAMAGVSRKTVAEAEGEGSLRLETALALTLALGIRMVWESEPAPTLETQADDELAVDEMDIDVDQGGPKW